MIRNYSLLRARVKEKKVVKKIQDYEREYNNANTIIKEREIIKIRCRYCGNLVDQGISKYPECGGTV
jgi:hypothetical protein